MWLLYGFYQDIDLFIASCFKDTVFITLGKPDDSPELAVFLGESPW
jgi:hypothetical protein